MRRWSRGGGGGGGGLRRIEVGSACGVRQLTHPEAFRVWMRGQYAAAAMNVAFDTSILPLQSKDSSNLQPCTHAGDDVKL